MGKFNGFLPFSIGKLLSVHLNHMLMLWLTFITWPITAYPKNHSPVICIIPYYNSFYMENFKFKFLDWWKGFERRKCSCKTNDKLHVSIPSCLLAITIKWKQVVFDFERDRYQIIRVCPDLYRRDFCWYLIMFPKNNFKRQKHDDSLKLDVHMPLQIEK